MLVQPKTKQYVMKSIKKAFQMNALIDRMVYVLQVKFAMVQASDKLHHELAHKYPLLADQLADPLLDFNEDVFRPSVEEESKDYASIVSVFEELLTETVALNGILRDAREAADEAGDSNIRVAMDKVIESYQPYIKQAIVLRDKAVLYADDIKCFDKDFNLFWLM